MNLQPIDGTASNRQLRWGTAIGTERYFKPSLYLSYSSVQFDLFGEIANGWEIIQPLLLTLEQDEDGYYIVSDDLFLMYGEGKTEIEAKGDYISALIDYYQVIDARAREDDDISRTILHNIQEYLRPVNQ